MLLTPAVLAQAPRSAISNCGLLASQVLNCPRFDFTYKIPFGWVDRTNEMDRPDDREAKDSTIRESVRPETLLAIFERPPGAPGETIDSAVVIAAEPLANYPQVKKASDYFGPITELAEKGGFKAEGEPYAISIGAKQFVRADFSKPRGNLTMYQSSLAVIENGYIVSFTFVAGGEEEVEELVSNLQFAGSGRKRPPNH